MQTATQDLVVVDQGRSAGRSGAWPRSRRAIAWRRWKSRGNRDPEDLPCNVQQGGARHHGGRKQHHRRESRRDRGQGLGLRAGARRGKVACRREQPPQGRGRRLPWRPCAAARRVPARARRVLQCPSDRPVYLHPDGDSREDRHAVIAFILRDRRRWHQASAAEEERRDDQEKRSEQRWALDNIIRTNGIDWNQPLYLGAGSASRTMPISPRSAGCRMADIGHGVRADRQAPRGMRRAPPGRRQHGDGDNWFMAAIHYNRRDQPAVRRAASNCTRSAGNCANYAAAASFGRAVASANGLAGNPRPACTCRRRHTASVVMSVRAWTSTTRRATSHSRSAASTAPRGIAVLAIDEPGQALGEAYVSMRTGSMPAALIDCSAGGRRSTPGRSASPSTARPAPSPWRRTAARIAATW